jgi:hypothetical protein
VTPPAVTVVVDGHIVGAADPARLVGGRVIGPIVPFGQALAQRITVDPVAGTITLECRDRRWTIALPLEGDRGPIGLGAAARALGDHVRYDGAAHTLFIASPVPRPLATMTPFAGYSPPPGVLPTFAPVERPTPRPTVSGIPQPRRTPIVSGGGT